MANGLDIYDVLYLVKTNLTDEELDQKSGFYENFIKKNGSSSVVKKCGIKDLSYTIKKQKNNYVKRSTKHKQFVGKKDWTKKLLAFVLEK